MPQATRSKKARSRSRVRGPDPGGPPAARLREQLTDACRAGQAFQVAWANATRQVIDSVPVAEERRHWTVALNATSRAWEASYLVAMAQPATAAAARSPSVASGAVWW